MAHDEHDIIVVGGGGSGLAAAVSAAEHGAHVVVLEKQPRCGGTTRIAVGSLTACQTSMQKAAGIDDTVEAHADDASRFAAPDIEERNCDELRRFFLGHTADTLDWLTGMGLRFHGPSPEPPNRVPRMHNVVPAARAYIDTLSDRLKKLGGTIITNADVRKLIQNQTGICHVEVDVLGTLKT